MTEAAKRAPSPETVAAEATEAAAEAAVAQIESGAQTIDDAAQVGRNAMDALMQAAGIALRSAEEINAETMAFSRRSIEESVAAARHAAASRNMAELVGAQADFARSTVDGMVRQMARINEMALAASRETMQPLTSRGAVAARGRSA